MQFNEVYEGYRVHKYRLNHKNTWKWQTHLGILVSDEFHGLDWKMPGHRRSCFLLMLLALDPENKRTSLGSCQWKIMAYLNRIDSPGYEVCWYTRTRQNQSHSRLCTVPPLDCLVHEIKHESYWLIILLVTQSNQSKKIILGLAPIDAFDSFAKWNIFTMQLGTQPFSNQYSLCLNMAFHLFLGWWEFSRGIETFCVLVRCHAYHLGSVESQSTPIENGTLLRPGTRLLTTQVMPLLTHAETLSIWTIKPLIFHPCNGQLLCFQ